MYSRGNRVMLGTYDHGRGALRVRYRAGGGGRILHDLERGRPLTFELHDAELAAKLDALALPLGVAAPVLEW